MLFSSHRLKKRAQFDCGTCCSVNLQLPSTVDVKGATPVLVKVSTTGACIHLSPWSSSTFRIQHEKGCLLKQGKSVCVAVCVLYSGCVSRVLELIEVCVYVCVCVFVCVSLCLCFCASSKTPEFKVEWSFCCAMVQVFSSKSVLFCCNECAWITVGFVTLLVKTKIRCDKTKNAQTSRHTKTRKIQRD